MVWKFDFLFLPLVLIGTLIIWYGAMYSALPNEITIHFDGSGNPDGSMSKLLFPITTTVFLILVLGFVSGIEFAIRRMSNVHSVTKWIMRMIRYFIITAVLSVVIELVRFNLGSASLSIFRLVVAVAILWAFCLALVAAIERRGLVQSGHVG